MKNRIAKYFDEFSLEAHVADTLWHGAMVTGKVELLVGETGQFLFDGSNGFLAPVTIETVIACFRT